MNLLDIPSELLIDVFMRLTKKELHQLLGTSKAFDLCLHQAHNKQEQEKQRVSMRWSKSNVVVPNYNDIYEVMRFKNVIVENDIIGSLETDDVYHYYDQVLHPIMSPQFLWIISPSCHIMNSNKYMIDTKVYSMVDKQLQLDYEIYNDSRVFFANEMMVCHNETMYAFSRNQIHRCVNKQWVMLWFIPLRYQETDGYLRVASWRQYTVMFLLKQHRIVLFDMETYRYTEVYTTGAPPLVVYPHHECRFLFHKDHLILFRIKPRWPIGIYCLTLSVIHGVIHGVWQDHVFDQDIAQIMFCRLQSDWFFSIKDNVISLCTRDEERWDLTINSSL